MNVSSPLNYAIISSKTNSLKPKNKSISSLREIKVNKQSEKSNFKKISIGMALLTSITFFALNFLKKNNKKNSISVSDLIVTGNNSLRNLFKEFTLDDYNFEKVFKINTHIHSYKSDGKLSPIEVLHKALECAEKLPEGEKFVFSLTDHDTIDGVLEIAEEISSKPQKYSKIKFIPGIELSVKHHNPKLSKKPVGLDYLIYGFDLKCPEIINETARRKKYLTNKTQDLIERINDKCPSLNLTFEDVVNNSDNKAVKNVSSNGYLKALNDRIRTILGEEYGDFINKEISEVFNDERYAYDADLSLEEAVKLTKKIDAFSSLAHPGKLNLDHAELVCEHSKMVEDIFKTFINNGGDAIEYNYMSYVPKRSWWDEVKNILKGTQLEYLKTGGYDSHGESINSR